MRLNGQIFGPGFAGAGTRIEFEADNNGIRVHTQEADDAAPRWSTIEFAKTGWDGAQLRLEWKGRAGVYSLAVSDAQAIAALKGLAGGKAAAKSARPDGATRSVVHLVIGVTVLLPLLLFAALVWQHDRIIAWAVSHIPVEQEMKLGEIIFAQHKTGLKLVESGPALEMVREVGARLTVNSAYKYQFHVAEDASVNAFAIPGGFVVMHTGLMQLAQTPEEVAGVLAHEVQHVELRHSLRGMAQSLGLYAALSLLVGDMSGLASLGGDLLRLKFSRNHETEADREGLKALVAAKINPLGMRDFFGRMAEQSKLDLGFLSTHPASDERMADMERLIKALPEAQIKLEPLPYDYAAIKASLGRPK